jgi:hypothetical protein
MKVQGVGALRRAAGFGAVALLAAASTVLPAGAKAAAPEPVRAAAARAGDIATLPADATYTLSPQLAAMLGRTTVDAAGLHALRTAARPGLPGERTPPVGTNLLWPALDDYNGGPIGIYLKQYTLRGVGKKIEVWVASGKDDVSTGTEFPPADCRNAIPHTTEITDAQVANLISQFDGNMYPKETKAFSTPPDHAGTYTLPGLVATGLDFAGDGDHTVTLIDNVRDANFYDFPKNRSYVAGFFAQILNELTDRNVMTIDAFDWLHRTGADPKDESSSDLCKSRPAHPFTYEGVFAHEWQHLLEQYQDTNEVNWINEGLSMFAETLVGYADTLRNVHEKNAQNDIFCFHGFGTIKGPANPNPVPCGGAQNSLTSWGDEGQGSEILADYGNARSFMLFLYDRYGTEFMSALHRDAKSQGLASLQDQLDTFVKGTKAEDVLHDYQLMNLVDTYVDGKAGTVTGIAKSRVTTASLDATVNLVNPSSYDLPGAGPNGADYLLLKQPGSALRSVAFAGDRTVLPAPADSSALPPLPGAQDAPAGSVSNWYVSLVGIDKAHHKVLVSSRDGAFSASWTAKQLEAFKAYPMVVAVIAHDNPADLDTAVEQPAKYSLQVNGTDQRGG